MATPSKACIRSTRKINESAHCSKVTAGVLLQDSLTLFQAAEAMKSLLASRCVHIFQVSCNRPSVHCTMENYSLISSPPRLGQLICWRHYSFFVFGLYSPVVNSAPSFLCASTEVALKTFYELTKRTKHKTQSIAT